MTQIPGGWLADRYGGKRVFGIPLILSAILTLLFPVLARTSVYLVFAVRILMGLLMVSSSNRIIITLMRTGYRLGW